MAKFFIPSRLQRWGLLVLLLPGICLMSWLGLYSATQGSYLAAVFLIAIGFTLALFLVFQVTMRVEMDERSLTRSWLFGRTVVPIDTIHSLRWRGSKGTTILAIQYGRKKFIQLSTNAMTKDGLHEIHGDLLAGAIAAHGLERQPLRPQFSDLVGYVDIADMIKAKPPG